MTTIIFVTAWIAASAGWVLHMALAEIVNRFTYPYRWRCARRGCRCEVHGTDAAWVASTANQHEAQETRR